MRVEIRDPIHGFMEFDEHEVRIINHPRFQRLRHIHQLAMAYLVYPGATHTRFEHSLGVCHIAGMLADRVGLDSCQRRRVRLAALLHDIGHGPFSHVSELILTACNENLAPGDMEEFHERVSLHVIRQFRKERLLNETDFEGVENVLVPGALEKTGSRQRSDKPPIRNVCRDIVSGPLDADKMDYLLRDSHYAGVLYGVYDLKRLAHGAILIEEKPNSYLGVEQENIPALDQFIIANHNMRVQVYGHRIRRIADLMLVRSVVTAIEDGNSAVKKLFDYRNDDSIVERYVHVDDAELVRLVMTGTHGDGKRMMERLIARRLPKEVLEVSLEDIADVELAEKLSDKGAEGTATRDLEEKLAQNLKLERDGFVFVEVRRDRPVRATRGEAAVDPSAIMVKLRNGGTKPYDQVSRFFRHGGFSDKDYLSVWVTVDEPDRDRREVMKGDYHRVATEVIRIKENGNGETGS